MKTLVAFSGGTDSTYVMYKLLTETDDEVTAILFKKDEITEVLNLAPNLSYTNVPYVLEELRKIRPFKFIEHFIQSKNQDNETKHYYTYFIKYAAPFLNDGTYDRIVTARTWEQYNQNIFNSNLKGSMAEIAAKRLFQREVTRGYIWNPLVTHDFHQNFNKAHVFLNLPENLMKYVNSCVSPDIKNDMAVSCGRCYKCLFNAKVRSFLAVGHSPDRIQKWTETKCYEYGGDSGLSAPIRKWIKIEHMDDPVQRYFMKKDTIEEVKNKPHYTFNSIKPEGIWDPTDPIT
jgi:7-cyano-7-deazaguanine synthase in queuosine biosynthesis